MSQAVPQKIVLKSTTKISLNERFSSIQTVNPRQQAGPSQAVQNVRAQMAANQNATAKNRRLAQQMANRPAVQAALRLKKRSLKQRLGTDVRSRLNFAGGQGTPRGGFQTAGFQRGGPQRGGLQRGRFQRGGIQRGGIQRGGLQGGGQQRGRAPRGMRGNRGFRGQQRRGRIMSGPGSLSGSQVSLNTVVSETGPSNRSRGFIPRGRGGARGMRRPRGGSFQRGGRSSRGGFRGAPQSGSFRGQGRRGRGRAQFTQTRGRGGRDVGRGARGAPRGTARGRGRGSGSMSREQLDNQLDEYMSKTKGQLDTDLDMYMSTGV